MLRTRIILAGLVLLAFGGVALAADGAKNEESLTVTAVVSIASAICSSLAVAVAMLYRELAKGRAIAAARIESLEKQLDAVREESAHTAQANTEWALEVQRKVYDTIEKNATVAEALLIARGKR